jgi:uncharacterized protein (TIRG00374 family)
VLLAIVFYFLMVVLSDIDGVAQAAETFDWVYVVPVLLLVMFNYLLRAERWHNYLRRVELGLPRRKSYWLFLSGLSMAITPGKAGEALKALFLKIEKNAPVERGFAVIFAERMSDMTGIIVLIAIGSFALPYGLVSCVAVVVLVALVLIVVSNERIGTRFVGWLKSKRRLSRIGGMAERSLKDARQLLTGRNLAEGTAFGAAAWAAECLAFYLIITGCSADVTILECVFIYAFSSVIGAVSLLPGGMGTTEATMIGLLVLLSVTASTASFVVILTRVCTLWFAVLLGIIALAAYSKRTPNASDI